MLWTRHVQGNPALVNSTFADSNYFANNFNDFGAAMMTLFALLIVNNWFVIMNTVCGCGAPFSRTILPRQARDRQKES